MFWRQPRSTAYPTSWKRMFLFSKLCVGFALDGEEISAQFEWVERRWIDSMTEEIRAPHAAKSIVYFRPGLHPY
jgi:hypothetical protein